MVSKNVSISLCGQEAGIDNIIDNKQHEQQICMKKFVSQGGMYFNYRGGTGCAYGLENA